MNIALHIFEPSVLVALLGEFGGGVDPASPFWPLTRSMVPASSSIWRDALAELGLLEGDRPRNDLLRALRAAAHPRKRFEVTKVAEHETVRVLAYSNGKDFAVASHGEGLCGLSLAIDQSQLVGQLMQTVGARPAQQGTSNVYRMDAVTFGMVGELIAAGLSETPRTLDELVLVLRPHLPQSHDGVGFLAALCEDGVLARDAEAYRFSDAFRPWVLAIHSQQHLRFHRLDLPAGRVAEGAPEVTALFFGRPGERLTMIPSGQQDGTALLFHPARRDLRELVDLLVGTSTQAQLRHISAGLRV